MDDSDPTPELPDDWCHVHARREVADVSDYQVCVECGHVFRAESDLLHAHRWRADADSELREGGEVPACPFCSAAWMFPPGSGSLL